MFLLKNRFRPALLFVFMTSLQHLSSENYVDIWKTLPEQYFFRQSPKRTSQSYKVSITGISKVNCKWMGSNTSQIIWCNLYSISYSNLHDLKLLCVWLSILYCLSSCYHVQEGERRVNIIRQFEQFYSVQTILPHQQYLFSSM